METVIKKWNYGDYNSGNYSGHTQAIQIGTLVLYFSYDTVVAFRDGFNTQRTCENAWSTTTGKHLNWLDGGREYRKNRLPLEQFQAELAEVLKAHNLSV